MHESLVHADGRKFKITNTVTNIISCIASDAKSGNNKNLDYVCACVCVCVCVYFAADYAALKISRIRVRLF